MRSNLIVIYIELMGHKKVILLLKRMVIERIRQPVKVALHILMVPCYRFTVVVI